jgi:hypothetical protein
MSLLSIAEKISDAHTLIGLGDTVGATAAVAQIVGTTALGVVVSAYTIPRVGLDLVFDSFSGDINIDVHSGPTSAIVKMLKKDFLQV